jgi:ABC-type nitrate/sulfonate/bicarbonate transport system substrate-binding protein
MTANRFGFPVILCLLVTFANASSAGAQKTSKMTVGFSATGGQYVNVFAAKDLGLFDKRGLDVTLNQLNSSAQTVASLRSNSVEIVTGPVAPVIDAIAKGITDFTIFGEAMPHTVLEVWVQPTIKSVKDLVGKTISSTNPNSLGDVMIGVWLNKNGIKKSDVNIVYLGGLSNLVSAMRAGKTEATLILPPLGEQLIPSGQKKLTDLRDIAYSNQGWTATRAYAKANADVLQRFTAAMVEAIAITKQDKQRVLPVLPKYTGVTNAEWNEYAYDFFAPLLQRVPRATLEVMKATQVLSPNESSQTIDLKPYLDNNYIDKLASEGFIDALYKK